MEVTISMAQPKVSVVCATFNHVGFIAQTLDAFLAQRADFPIEVLVHDDASTDGTSDIVRAYAERHPGVIIPIIQAVNVYSQGEKPWLICFERARGKYIALCEGDDYWTDPLKLQKQVDFMEAHPEFVLCHHNADIIDGTGKLIKTEKLPEEHQRDHSQQELQRWGLFALTLSVLFRNVLDMSVPVPEHNQVRNGDSFLWMRLGAHGKAHYMPEIEPAMYRSHGGGIWSGLAQSDKRLTALNTSVWMGLYYARIGEAELAKYFAERINRMAKEPFEVYPVVQRRAYKWFVRIMALLGVSIPKG